MYVDVSSFRKRCEITYFVFPLEKILILELTVITTWHPVTSIDVITSAPLVITMLSISNVEPSVLITPLKFSSYQPVSPFNPASTPPCVEFGLYKSGFAS